MIVIQLISTTLNLWSEPKNSVSCHQTVIQSKVILQCFTQPNPCSTLLILLSIRKCVATYWHDAPEALSTNKKEAWFVRFLDWVAVISIMPTSSCQTLVNDKYKASQASFLWNSLTEICKTLHYKHLATCVNKLHWIYQSFPHQTLQWMICQSSSYVTTILHCTILICRSLSFKCHIAE